MPETLNYVSKGSQIPPPSRVLRVSLGLGLASGFFHLLFWRWTYTGGGDGLMALLFAFCFALVGVVLSLIGLRLTSGRPMGWICLLLSGALLILVFCVPVPPWMFP
jgi:hypothetical protein